LIWCLVLGKSGQNMVKRAIFSENMRTTLPLTPDGETTSTLYYFCIKLRHFASRMTPIDTHSFIPIPSKTRFCNTLSNLCAKLVIFQKNSVPKGLKMLNKIIFCNFSQYILNVLLNPILTSCFACFWTVSDNCLKIIKYNFNNSF